MGKQLWGPQDFLKGFQTIHLTSASFLPTVFPPKMLITTNSCTIRGFFGVHQRLPSDSLEFMFLDTNHSPLSLFFQNPPPPCFSSLLFSLPHPWEFVIFHICLLSFYWGFRRDKLYMSVHVCVPNLPSLPRKSRLSLPCLPKWSKLEEELLGTMRDRR